MPNFSNLSDDEVKSAYRKAKPFSADESALGAEMQRRESSSRSNTIARQDSVTSPKPTSGYAITPSSQQLNRQNQVIGSSPQQAGNKISEPTGPLSGGAAFSNQKLQSLKVSKVQSNRFAPNSTTLLRQDRLTGSLPETIDPIGDPTAELILSARGTVYLVKMSAEYGPGLYAIDNLTRKTLAPDSPTGLRDKITFEDRGGLTGTKSIILINGIEFNQSDITSQIPCLNNFKAFYSFGQNFGQAAIIGEVLLGPLGDIDVDGVKRIIDFFWSNRVSEKRVPIGVSISGEAHWVYLTGLKIGQIDAQFHILPFVLVGTLLDIKRDRANRINIQGKVISDGDLDEPSLFKALTNPSGRIGSTSKTWKGPFKLPPDGPEIGNGNQAGHISADNDPSEADIAEAEAAAAARGEPTSYAGAVANFTAADIRDKIANKGEVTTAAKETQLLIEERKRIEQNKDRIARETGSRPGRTSEDDTLDRAIKFGSERAAAEANLRALQAEEAAPLTPQQWLDDPSRQDQLKNFRVQMSKAAQYNEGLAARLGPEAFDKETIQEQKKEEVERIFNPTIVN